AAFSASVTVNCQYRFTVIQLWVYRHQYPRDGGFHCDGSWSPFARLVLAETASSCGRVMSLANSVRLPSVQSFAPDRHAFASGTMWSMSSRLGSVTVRLSYGLTQCPLVTWQLWLVCTSVPSRLSTYSRVSHSLPC